nr:lysophospholipase [Lachnospiraceae bacterium]MBQ8253821.1 lysophospholipase [Lachnospiraceae bacterium]
MRKEEFTFDSRDGKSKIYACSWIPEEPPLCILQIIHGMNDHMGRYEEFASYLAQRGILVVGEDHLGHGKTVPDGGTYGYFCEHDPATVVVRDVHRLKKITEEKYPTVPYIIFGHSMGSFIVRNYIARYGTGIRGAILSGTGTPTKAELNFGKCLAKIMEKVKGPKEVVGLLHDISRKSYMSGIKNAKTEHDWLTTDEDEIEKYAGDPLCTGFRFTVNGYQTLFELAYRMQEKEILHKIPKKLPILIVSGTEDPVGAKGLAPKQLYDEYLNLDLTKVTLKLYQGARHELLFEKVKDTAREDIYSWIEKVAMEIQGGK